jgi:hypothetical protein
LNSFAFGVGGHFGFDGFEVVVPVKQNVRDWTLATQSTREMLAADPQNGSGFANLFDLRLAARFRLFACDCHKQQIETLFVSVASIFVVSKRSE